MLPPEEKHILDAIKKKVQGTWLPAPTGPGLWPAGVPTKDIRFWAWVVEIGPSVYIFADIDTAKPPTEDDWTGTLQWHPVKEMPYIQWHSSGPLPLPPLPEK